MAFVSVITPTYNRASLLDEAINSVLNQTYTDFEMVIVDDDSTDNTEEVIHSFSDPRLFYIKQPHMGPSCARNNGIESSTGEYVAFLDDDDLFLPNKLALQVAKVAEYPSAGLVYGLYLSSAGKEGLLKTAGEYHQEIKLQRLLLGPVFQWSTVMVRRSLLDEVGGFSGAFCGEDWELTIQLALAGCQMVCVPEPVTLVRRQTDSLTRDTECMSTVLDVIDRVFSDPRMPVELLEHKDLACSSQLIRIATTYFVNFKYELGSEILQRAFLTCPSLKNELLDFLVNTLVYRIRGLSIDNSQEVLRQVTKTLPGEPAFVKKLKRQLWGKYYEIESFQSFQSGHNADCVKNVILSVSKTPLRLKNRGLLAIFVKSMVGYNVPEQNKELYSPVLN